jgi:ABC-type uncharacterized transport system substrate-binding protein
MTQSIKTAIVAVLFLLSPAQLTVAKDGAKEGVKIDAKYKGKLKGKKVLHIDSYHEGYPWSDMIHKGIVDTLKGTGAELLTFRMDAKNHPKKEEKAEAGRKAKEYIESHKPDLVIVSDDDAVAYVLEPFYKNSALPFVFCGVNWDAAKYGLPYKNATGMIEVDFISAFYSNLRQFSKGDRIAFMGADTETDRTTANFYKDKFFHEKLTKTYFVKDFDDFKKQFVQAQGEVDMIYFNNKGSVKNWNDEEAAKFIMANIKIPTSSNSLSTSPFVLLVMGKDGEEQGQWAAKAGLKILTGTSAGTIPIEENKRIKFVVNMEIATKLKAVFNMSILKTAERVTSKDWTKYLVTTSVPAK